MPSDSVLSEVGRAFPFSAWPRSSPSSRYRNIARCCSCSVWPRILRDSRGRRNWYIGCHGRCGKSCPVHRDSYRRFQMPVYKFFAHVVIHRQPDDLTSEAVQNHRSVKFSVRALHFCNIFDPLFVGLFSCEVLPYQVLAFLCLRVFAGYSVL